MPHIAALDGEDVPDIHQSAWIAPGATIVGNVKIGPNSSIWYGSVLRGDDEAIVVGGGCNVQDLSCLHADAGEPAILEDRVSLGHRATVHGAYVETGALIGIGAIVLGGAHIGAGSLIAAGAVIGPGKRIPAGVLAAGVPAKIIRDLTDDDRAIFAETPERYQAKMARHQVSRPMRRS